MSIVLPKSLLSEKKAIIEDELIRLRYALSHDFEDHSVPALPAIKEEMDDGYNEVMVFKNTPVAGHTMIARTPWSTEVVEFTDDSATGLSLGELINKVDEFLVSVKG